jgi:C1A family cysteine protease
MNKNPFQTPKKASQMIYTTVAALSIFASSVVAATTYSSNPENLKFMWEAFKRDFNKKYDTMNEEASRYEVFMENLKVIDARNALEKAAGGSAVHGITQFSDISQEEFSSRYLLSKPSMKSKNTKVMTDIPTYTGPAGLVDWTGVLTTAVKNQGYCGSCWAFSATEQIESDSMRSLKTSYLLSPEQITQCDKTSYGCGGGWTEHAYDYVTKAGGIETESDYPYTSYLGVTGTCSADSSKFVIGVSGYTTISGETNMASYVQSTGPLSVCVDASSWNSYTGGVMSSCGKRVDHCVQAVGVDARTGGYWKVRNSWGASWGEAGYIRLSYGSNTCNIASDPTWVSVFKA